MPPPCNGDRMLRITKQSDYAIVVLAHLANHGPTLNARELAQETGIPLPMVSKILKQLSRSDVVRSTRGANGGYSLARDPEAISVVDLIDALEGPVGLTECSIPGQCSLELSCMARHKWQTINERIRVLLQDVSLAEMIGTDMTNVESPAL